MHLIKLLLAGCQLLLGWHPKVNRLQLTAGWFWALAMLSLLTELAFDFAAVLPPRLFDLNALQTWAVFLLVLLSIGMLAARWCRQPSLIWQLPVLLLSADIVRNLLLLPVYNWLIHAPETPWQVYQWLWYGSIIWLAIPVITALRSLQPWQYRRRQILPAISHPIIVYLLASQLLLADFWQTDYSEYYKNAETAESTPNFNTERVLFRQAAMLDNIIAGLSPQRPEVTDMYTVHVAGYGEQDVFMKEALFTEQLFADTFAAEGRQITLINNPEVIDSHPLATVSNLKTALNGLAGVMDLEEDILFLFITSHGSKNHWLSFSLYNLPLNNLSADYLATLIKESGIRSKVVVVSACFSGGFIEPLQDNNSLIITAARDDRHSFGCSDDTDMTYFGRAFFQIGLAETKSFTDAFEIAKQHLSEWENEQGYPASEPQISNAPELLNKLVKWASELSSL